jgi:hypothetical protein
MSAEKYKQAVVRLGELLRMSSVTITWSSLNTRMQLLSRCGYRIGEHSGKMRTGQAE